MSLFALLHMAFVFWVVMDGVGNVPLFAALLSPFDPPKQRWIIIRESLIALAVMVTFFFFGEGFFKLLQISSSSLQIAGGIILFLIAIRFIFSVPPDEGIKRIPRDPLIVPLAIPAFAGPGILATISLYGKQLGDGQLAVLLAILIGWIFTVPVLLLSSTLKKLLKSNGLVALERLFGYIIILIATQMATGGVLSILKNH